MTNRMERLLGLGSIASSRAIPGTSQENEGREFRFVGESPNENFPSFFKKLVRHVAPPLAVGGGVVVEGCRITLPTGESLQAISYRGDISGWRQQIAKGADALGVVVGLIDGEQLILSDSRTYSLADCQVAFE